MKTRLLAPTFVLIAAGFIGWFAADRWLAREWHGDRKLAAEYRRKYGRPAEESSKPTEKQASAADIQFDDAASRMGLDFVYDDGATGVYHLMETLGGGMAAADFDLDGRIDLFFPNGCKLPITGSESRRSALFLRIGDHKTEGRFAETARLAGVDDVVYGHGAAAADFDHDGFDDLLVTGFHSLQLFRNSGDGTFVRHPLPDPGTRWWTSAVWFDADSDGDLDAYVCAYATVDVEHPKDCRRGEIRMHCHPNAYPAQPDVLLRNDGAGRFDDATAEYGLTESRGRGLGVAAADFNGDGKPDLYVANDTTDAYLWARQPSTKPQFGNVAADLGVGLTGDGTTMAGMGVGVGDYDRNGKQDLFITDFFEAGASLFANLGEQGFVPKSNAVGLLAPTRRRLGFGTVFIDADLDGWPDLAALNGHVSDFSAIGIPYRMNAQFFRNEGGTRFADLSNGVGEFFRKPLLGRGLATLDADDDGRPDLVASNIRDPAALLLNRTKNAGRWIGFSFVGRTSARGTRNVIVEIRRGEKTDRYEQHSGGGYLSSSDPRLIIGLGRGNAVVDEVVVRWPSGIVQRISKPTLDKYHQLVEPLENSP